MTKNTIELLKQVRKFAATPPEYERSSVSRRQ
jgi:hypothetical protein